MTRKICVFCETWGSGGIESFLHNVLLCMDLTGLEIDIVAEMIGESLFTDHLRDAGVRFVELSGSIRKPLSNFRAFRSLLRRRKYDAVHLNIYQGMSLYYARLAQKAGVPVRIAHSHNSALRKSAARLIKQGIHRFFSLRCTDSATDLWACSHEAAAFMFPREALRTRGHRFIPNGIDTARFRFRGDVREQIREELGLEGAFVVGHVGRLCYQKNQRFLLSMLPALLRLRPESRLLLVGEGEDLDGLRRYAGELGISDKVIFYGVSGQVETLLWAMDAFALPSRFEGLCIVAVEAQAAGLPLLCSEGVTKEAGITALARWEPLDPELWAKVLAGTPDAERQSSADSVREAGFDVARVGKSIEEAYRCI